MAAALLMAVVNAKYNFTFVDIGCQERIVMVAYYEIHRLFKNWILMN